MSTRDKGRVALRRRSLISGGLAAVAVAGLVMAFPLASAQEQPRSAAPRYFGVNLPSGSFGSRKGPSVHGKDYIYPTGKIAQPFQAMGMNTVRLAFKWERLQPQPMGPLDPVELGLIERSIAELGQFDTIVLNVHNYARYRGTALDKPGRSGEMLADLWAKLAERYKGDRRIVFGIMNEPHGMSAAAWRGIADRTVAAIRRTGARNLVLVPGTRWTGGHSWNKGGPLSNAAVMSGFKDPANNFAFEIHQYLDADSSGTKKDCVGERVGRERLEEVTRWLRQQRAKGFLAEFGVPPTPVCLAALDDLMTFLRANGDVWVGWTYWAGGDWWGSYPFSIQPKDGVPKPQSAVLQRHIATYRGAR
jgi:endoglucanase